MPSRFSSDHSVEDARALAAKLGIQFQIIPIEPAHAAYESIALASPGFPRPPLMPAT